MAIQQDLIDLIRFNGGYGDFMGFDADLMGLKLNGVFF